MIRPTRPHSVNDLRWRKLFEDAWVTLRIDEAGRVVHYARRHAPFETVEQVETSNNGVLLALAPLPRASLGLLVDLRDTPDPAELTDRVPLRKEAMEAAMAQHRPTLLRGFGRRAMLLRTVIGKLQLERHLKQDGLAAVVTNVERDALAALLPDP